MPDKPEIPADKLAAVYVKIRDARQDLAKKYEQEDAVLEEKLKLIQGHLLELCKSTGAESIRTKSGTIMRTVKTRYFTSDWSNMYSFIRENDALELLEQRVHQTNMKKFLEENPESIPKGLNISSQYTVTVRRS